MLVYEGLLGMWLKVLGIISHALKYYEPPLQPFVSTTPIYHLADILPGLVSELLWVSGPHYPGWTVLTQHLAILILTFLYPVY